MASCNTVRMPMAESWLKRADDCAAAADDNDEIDRLYRVPEWDSNSEAWTREIRPSSPFMYTYR
jgi:hypothetical protein